MVTNIMTVKFVNGREHTYSKKARLGRSFDLYRSDIPSDVDYVVFYEYDRETGKKSDFSAKWYIGNEFTYEEAKVQLGMCQEKLSHLRDEFEVNSVEDCKRAIATMEARGLKRAVKTQTGKWIAVEDGDHISAPRN